MVPASLLRYVADNEYSLPLDPTDQKQPLVIPVISEELEIARKKIALGTVRISKKITRRDEIVDEPVVAERIEIDRKAVNRVVDAAPPVRQEGDTMVIPLLEEVLVVEKRLVLREELHVRRVREESRMRQTITLESEHADVERIDERRAGDRSTSPRSPWPNHQSRLEGAGNMERTLVGVFDSNQEAQAVKQELVQFGIQESQVHVRADENGATGSLTGVGETTSSDTTTSRKPGFFERLFGGLDADEDHVSQYSEAMNRGHCVVVVDSVSDDRVDDAAQIMTRHGAIDIDERASSWRSGSSGSMAGTNPSGASALLSGAANTDRSMDRTTDRTSMTSDSGESMTERAGDAMERGAEAVKRGAKKVANAMTPDNDDTTRTTGTMGTTDMTGATGLTGTTRTSRDLPEGTRIPVVEEQLEVGKRQVLRGGVRVYTRMTERPVEEQVTLREEHAHVERRPVDRPASEADLNTAFKEGSIELQETAEQPVVSKTARVVEEVEVGKEVSERTETVNDKVRRTEVEVEDLPASRAKTGQDQVTRRQNR